jgi:regulator of RNase E activity RraB
MFTNTESQIETIREIFETAKREDNWNLDEPMLYSFYWVDEDVDKLEKLGLHLEKEGFDFVDVFELGDEETNEPTGEYLLHIDKVGVYTPESLAEQNVKFQNLADEFEIETYDGWEFGEVGDEDEEENEE